MAATFNRLHTWALTEVITTSQLNQEFDNILNNLDPTGIGSYSTSVAQMQIVTSPGTPGAESLATSLAGEVERLRYMIKSILGVSASQWYSPPTTDLTQIKAALGSALNVSRVISGPSSTASSAARFITPGNTTAAITINGGGTAPLVYAVNGTNYTISTNLVVGSLGTAAVANAIINDPALVGQESSKWQGEDGTTLAISNASAAISALVGSWGAFSVTDSGKTEYFMAYVQSATAFTNCLRGYFFNSSLLPVQRIPINNNSTVSLMKLAWLYGTTASAVLVGYSPPTFAYLQPGSPATGDYWFNLSTNIWMTFNSATWVTAGSTLLGVCAQTTAFSVAARSFDYAGSAIPYSNLVLNYNDTSSMVAQNWGSKIGVGASLIDFRNTKPQWSSAALDPNGTVAFTAATTYWAYVGETGQLNLSWQKPYQSAGNGQGWYHPYENWRTVGYMRTNGSTAFDSTTLTSYLLDVNATPTVGVAYNYFVNGGFDYWQAVGTAAAVTAAGGSSPTNVLSYVPDQWYVNNILGAGSAEGVITGSQQVAANPGSSFGFQVIVSTTPSGTGVQSGLEVYQSLSNLASLALINKTVSVGVLAKATGNVNAIGISLMYNTTTTKVATGSGTVLGTEVIRNINSTGWTLASLINQTVGTAMTTNGILGVRIRVAGVSSGNAWDLNNGFILEQAQMNKGGLAAWARQYDDPANELVACQYFFEKSYPVATPPGTAAGAAFINGAIISPVFGNAAGTTTSVFAVTFKTRKVKNPLITYYDGSGTTSKVFGVVGASTAFVNTPGGGISTSINATSEVNFWFNVGGMAAAGSISAVGFQWIADARL